MGPYLVPSNGTFRLPQTWNHFRVLFYPLAIGGYTALGLLDFVGIGFGVLVQFGEDFLLLVSALFKVFELIQPLLVDIKS